MLYLLLFINLFKPPQLTSNQYVAIATEEGFSLLDNDSIYRWNPSAGWTAAKLITKDFEAKDKMGIHFNKQIFVLSRGIGKVYELTGDTLRRRDNSFDWRSRYGALLTGHKARIYCFGGYGLYSEKNNLIYYDQRIGEWSQEEFSSQAHVPQLLTRGVFQHSDSLVYFINRQWFDPANKVIEDKAILTYSFNTKKWTPIGTFNPALEGITYRETITGSETYIYNRQNLIAEFDFPNNLFKRYSNPNLGVIKDTRIIIFNPKIARFLVVVENGAETLEAPYVFTKEELMGQQYESIPIYIPLKRYNSALLFGGLILLFLGIVYYYFRVKKPTLVEQIKTNTKRIVEKLNEDERFIFFVIMESYPKSVPLPELMVNFAVQLTHESKVKKYRVSIKRIEAVIQDELKIKEAIFMVKRSTDDKRIKEIGLSRELAD